MPSAIDISSLISSQSRWEIAEYVFSGFVAIGCFGEFVHECTDWFSAHSLWKRSGGAASALLLVAALAAEIPTQCEVNRISGIIVRELSRREAETRLRAAEIERKYSRRTLLPEQGDAILASLGDRKFPLKIQYFVSDPEAFDFAGQIEGLLKKSQLVITTQNIVPLVPPLGIVLMGPDSPDKNALAAALTAAHLPYRSGNAQLTAIDDLQTLRMSIGGRTPPK